MCRSSQFLAFVIVLSATLGNAALVPHISLPSDVPRFQQVLQDMTVAGASRKVVDAFSTVSNEARKVLNNFASASKDFGIGASAGAVSSFLVFPIDLAKTRIQHEIVMSGSKPIYANTLQCLSEVVKKEGLKGLYSGVLPVIVGSAPVSALQIGGNNKVKSYFAQKLNVRISDVPLHLELLAGAFGGCCQVIAANPMESVKVIKQVQGHKAGSTLTIASKIGIAGLYEGWTACMLRDVAFSAIYFPLFAHTKQWLVDRENPDPSKPRTERLVHSFIAGLVAGVPAAGLTTPADVIKTRMQAGIMTGQSLSMATATKALWAEAGLPGFFKGVGPRVGRVAPQLALTLFLFDAISKAITAAEKTAAPALAGENAKGRR